MKVTVVGAGVVGLCAAWQLVSQGAEVTVIDQGPIPNPGSASFDSHRMIRPHYGAQAAYAAMTLQALQVWDDLWSDLGENHFARTGVLALDCGGSFWISQTNDILTNLGIAFERVAGSELRDRYPHLDVPKDRQAAILAPDAGVLFADRILLGLVAWLKQNGVRLVSETQVCHIDIAARTCSTRDGRNFVADKIVVAAGAWSGRLIPGLSRRVVPTRSLVAYVSAPAAQVDNWHVSPAAFFITEKAQLYALPPVAGTELKFGGVQLMSPADPDRTVPHFPEAIAETRYAFRSYLKDGDRYTDLRAAGGYYADTADKRFIVEGNESVLVVTGCGGRMFKFGAVMGRRVSEWASGLIEADELSKWASGLDK